MKKVMILIALMAIAFAGNTECNNTVDEDSISIGELIIDDGSEVINNQDIEKPQKSD